MWHTVFIALHAVAGSVAFVAGCVALRRGVLFTVYWWSLVGMVLFLVLAIAADWVELEVPVRLLFSAFVVLGGVMLWRAALARRVRPTDATGPSARYIDHVGFTLVALFDAFVVITVLNLGVSAWLVAATGIAVAIAGHFVLQVAKNRLVPASPMPATR
jgi:hypothetical protein